MIPSKSPWLLRPFAKPTASVRLFCFPHAGGSASVFRRWVAKAPASVEVVPVELPGRGARFREPLVGDVKAMVAALHAGLKDAHDLPIALYGHSSGALVAYEWAKLLVTERRRLVHLFASGREAPSVREKDPIAHLPDAVLLAALAKDGGIPSDVAAHPELLELVLPIIRSDARMSDEYVYTPPPSPPLACPLSVFTASGDALDDGEVLAWNNETSSRFEHHALEGDHFVFYDDEKGILAHMVSALTTL